MVVTRLHAERQRDTRFAACLLEKPGAQAVIEELVRISLVDQELVEPLSVLNQIAGVMRTPRRLVGPI
jgi:hypothetical protein